MANDVSVKIGIDGENEFKSALNGINSQIKNLNSEMNTVVSSMTGMEDAEEIAAKKTDILGRSVDATKQKITVISGEYDRAKKRLSELGNELDQVKRDFGDNSAQAAKAQRAYNRQAKEVNDLGTQLNNATSDLNRIEKEMRDVASEAYDAAAAFDNMGSSVSGIGSSFSGAFAGALSGGAVIGGIQALASGISNIVNETEEYRKIMGTLEVSSKRAGYTAEQTAQTYNQLYGVLGDTQQAATAAANLQALGLSQQELTRLTDGAIGAWATYGDSIPIDSLAEAINETVQAGKVTGSFADVLNWAGTNEDEFNAKLAAANSESERANIVLKELADQGLMDAAEGWRQNNADILAANEAAAGMSDSMAQFGELLSPITTGAKNAFNSLLQGVLSIVNAFKTGGFQGAMAQAEGLVSSLISTISTEVPRLIQSGSEIISNIAAGIGESIPLVLQTIPGLIAKYINFLAEQYPTIKETGITFIKNLVLGIINGIPHLVGELPKIIEAFVNYASTALPVLAEQGTSFLVSLAGGIITNIPYLYAQLPKIITAIVKGLARLIGGIIQAGRAIVEGLWKGISGAAGWLMNKIQGWAGGILDGIKGFFGIHSPSRVMRDQVGLMIAEGMAEGLKKGEKDIIDASDNINNKLLKNEELFAANYSKKSGVISAMQTPSRRISREDMYNAASATVNGMVSSGASMNTQTVIIPVNLNGKQIAEVVFDPLKNVAKQRGVAFG